MLKTATNIIYNKLFIPVSNFFFKIYSVFNDKAKERESKWKELLISIPAKPVGKIRILVHAASMGEFEQAKPVIELLKKIKPEYEIIGSFFSPSGFQNQSNYKELDYAVYMPVDTKSNAKKFVDSIEPDISIFVRYDLWLNHLNNLTDSGCINYLICAAKPADSIFLGLSFVKSYLKQCYENFAKIFTVGDNHSDFIKSLSQISDIITLTDTRSDRILNMINNSKANPVIPQEILSHYFTLIAGSSWQKDEEIISQAVNEINKQKFIIRVIYVPHEPSKQNIDRIRILHERVILLSNIIEESSIFDINKIKSNLENSHIAVDSIGKLLRLYANGDAAYIGCGFGDGVHSVSEPAGYGLPIVSGPNIQKMPDAVSLYEAGALKIIQNKDELKKWLLKMIEDDFQRKRTGKLVEDYIISTAGSSKKIVENILNSRSN